LNDDPLDTLYRLEICGRHVGYVRPELAEKLVEKAPDSLCRTGPRG
jgi:hypothetical protein